MCKPKRKPKTKLIKMQLTVRVPRSATAAQARREVRTLINHQANYLDFLPDWTEMTVKVAKCGPAPR